MPQPAVLWRSAARTHVGKVRKLNEDAVLDLPERGVWAVADGMGGHHAGDHASASVAAALGDVPMGLGHDALVHVAADRLQQVNASLFLQGQREAQRLMGSTVVVLLSREARAAVLWAGDSRVYMLRASQLRLLTRDHSRVQELITSGELRPEDAEQHPSANVITRAVGVAATLALDVLEFEVQNGDAFVLCSDGLSRYVSESVMSRAAADPDCARGCATMIERALETPARDNLSVVIARASFQDNQARTLRNPAVPAPDAKNPDDAPTVMDTR